MAALGVVLAGVAAACADADSSSARKALVVDTLVRADLPLLRARPALVAGKYRRMGSGLFDFYRGSFSLFLRDSREGVSPVSRTHFGEGGPLVDGIGDAHPENFALLRASDGTFALEPNDFDGADRYPYLWELRRLAAGMVIASRLSNPMDPEAQKRAVAAEHDCARIVASSYAEAIARYAAGAPPERTSNDESSAYLADLFRRALRDAPLRAELTDLTTLVGSSRRLVRGGIDPSEPENTFADLPSWAIDALSPTLLQYRQTLVNPPAPEFFRVLDAVREFGSGVASWPRVRVIVLVRGPSDASTDDVLLELKELADSGVAGWFPPGVPADSVQSRVELEMRSAWARADADPLWGTSTWLGFPVQVRTESDAFKNVRIKRLDDDLGTPDAIAGLARALGIQIARIHARSRIEGDRPCRHIASLVATDPVGFADEQATIAVQMADIATQDWILFREALVELGPTLGFPQEDSEPASPSLREIYGQPPPMSSAPPGP